MSNNVLSKATRISDKGIALIKSFEGFMAKPYLCPANVPTIGYGTTVYPDGRKVSLKDKPINEAIALVYLRHDVEQFERGVDALVRDDITQGQFDALVSFAYNLGVNALRKSTLLKEVNFNPNSKTIRAEFMRWVNAGGKRLEGLVNRRKAEVDLYYS